MRAGRISRYHAVISGEAILGANIIRDLFAGVRKIVRGCPSAYEKELRAAQKVAFDELEQKAPDLGANAVVGIDLDDEAVVEGVPMVTAGGTAVTIDQRLSLPSGSARSDHVGRSFLSRAGPGTRCERRPRLAGPAGSAVAAGPGLW